MSWRRTVTGVPRLPEDVSREEVADLQRVAGVFKMADLQTICHNIHTDQDFLNPSIGTFLTDMTGAEMKRVFLNQPDYADIIFKVQGERLHTRVM
ncbi:hypothetical protein C0Q70_04400 [Pomacea canaliculata]|uniref:Uncharacterized protein n=1 Tax=Pomacea canaliculata TaxID=400727 RepID=A0A2T7PVF5_POMCA|nr:hypothetical protein C0Q70_04400 [Pomacea canaliculata]